MDNGIVLLLTFLITALFIVVVQIMFYRQRKRHASEYSSIWEQFDSIKDTRNYGDIIELGNKLVYNKSLKPEHLKVISLIAIKHDQWHPDFETLRLNAFNKRLDWDSHQYRHNF